MENIYQILVSLTTVVIVLAASWFAYDQGYMDPLIEKFGYVSRGCCFSGRTGGGEGWVGDVEGGLHISIEMWFSRMKRLCTDRERTGFLPKTEST